MILFVAGVAVAAAANCTFVAAVLTSVAIVAMASQAFVMPAFAVVLWNFVFLEIPEKSRISVRKICLCTEIRDFSGVSKKVEFHIMGE